VRTVHQSTSSDIRDAMPPKKKRLKTKQTNQSEAIGLDDYKTHPQDKKEESDQEATVKLFIDSFCQLDKQGRLDALKDIIGTFNAAEIDQALELMDARLSAKEEQSNCSSTSGVAIKEECDTNMVVVNPVVEDNSDIEDSDREGELNPLSNFSNGDMERFSVKEETEDSD